MLGGDAMKTAALIVTTGLPRISGIRALSEQVGAIHAGQRMIAAFQRCGVMLTGLVVGPEDKKAERAFVQDGVIFLRCAATASFDDGVRQGLSFLRDKFDQVFVVPGDTPLFLPSSLEVLLDTDSPIAIPVCSRMHGWPVLLRSSAVDAYLSGSQPLDAFLDSGSLERSCPAVRDSGILIRSGEMGHRRELIRLHDRQLFRPSVEVALTNGAQIFDSRMCMLLHLVDSTRSVLDACSLMQMSYSAAWKLLNQVEDELGFPLVRRIRGGPEGSGTELTEKGRSLMEAYDRYTAQLSKQAQELYQLHFSGLSE